MIAQGRLFIIIIGLLCSLLYSQIITEEEYGIIYEVLERAGLDKESLNFEKDWGFSTEFKVEGIVDIINNPLKYPKFAEEIKEIITAKDLRALSNFLADFIFSGLTNKKNIAAVENSDYFETYFDDFVNRPRHLITYGENLFDLTERHYKKAMQQLTLEDKEALTYLSYVMWADNEDRKIYEQELVFLVEYKEKYSGMTTKDYEAIIEKIDWESFIKAKQVFLSGAEVLKKRVSEINFNNRRAISRNTRWGRFVIGTNSSNTYNSDEAIVFLIEPGGNNIYYNNFNTDFDNPFYLMLDLEGNNIWRNSNTGGLFRVLGGIGWSASLCGEDIYDGGDLSFSSFIGFQYHQSGKGDDYYNTGRYSQAAATFGISVCSNEGGNNNYVNTGYGQGFGGTLGSGVLIDYEGHDTYYSGGKYLHKPLRPEDHRSMAQGVGFGSRPGWGGGVGLLYDGEGNDAYTGGVYAQGVGYWYALGMLLDGGGNDTFRAVQYSQGSGIHLAGGFLFNKSGDNSYYSRYGPGQGAGHDYAVGFFVDREGNDHYSIDGGNGLGLTNSVGIFLDVEGNDRYERVRDTNYGYANIARNSGGIGVFLDTGGEDVYADSQFSNDSFWIRGTYGIGLDTTLVTVKEEIKDDEELDIDEELAVIDTLSSVSEIFKIASEWEVGSSIERVRRARKRIMDFEKEAAEYIYENKLASYSGLEGRAIVAFAKESDIFTEYLKKGLTSEDSLLVKSSINLAAVLQEETFFEQLKEYLQQNKYEVNIITALSAFKTDDSVSLLEGFVNSPSEAKRFLAAQSLKEIDNERSRELLSKMKNDGSFLIRTLVKLALPDDD